MAIHRHEIDRRTLFTAGLGTTLAAVVGADVASPGTASAVPSAEFPWIIDCDSWDARPPSSPIQVTGNTTNKIMLHHMAFPNVTDYSREQAIRLARECQDLHMDANGWPDTGQHFTVSRGGYVLEGRHRSLETLEIGEHQVIGTHCPGVNGNAIGIENEGTYITETPPQALVDSLVRLCVAVAQKFGLHAWDIFGHWDFRTTQCPGIAFYAQFPMVRSRVLAAMGTSPDEIPQRRWPDITRFVDGPVIQVAQYLLNNVGYTDLVPDGISGGDMNDVVADFQASNGISVDPDATFDQATWEALVPDLWKNASGPAVNAVQVMLSRKGYSDVTVNGSYDQATERAVRGMQRVHGLRPTGKVDTSTWCAVVGGSVREAFQVA